MLKFYETFQRYDTPQALQGDVYDVENNPLITIKNFSKINIFVGPNNSGKSKLIRELIRQAPAKYYDEKNWKRITGLINQLFTIVDQKLAEEPITKDYLEISNSSNGIIFHSANFARHHKKLVEYIPNYNLVETLNSLKTTFIISLGNLDRTSSFYLLKKGSARNTLNTDDKLTVLNLVDAIRREVNPLIEDLRNFEFNSSAFQEVPRIYIPAIRTLRPFGMTADIKKATTDEYKFAQLVSIYNGQDFADEVFELTNTNYTSRQKLTEFENLISQEFFGLQQVKLTFDKKEKILLIKIGSEIEKPIYDLGDGLQMILILLFPFFTFSSGLIAIEEPEIFIHPGLQKTFINFLTNHPRVQNFQVFIATHSNHVIDSINQSDLVSIFSIKRREKQKESSIEAHPDFIIDNIAFGDENILKLLGITATSVYLSNCTIWVEGVTDKLYIQKYMSEYLKKVETNSKYSRCKEYKEGIHYSFVFTAGDSIIHWDFSEDSEYQVNTQDIIVRKFCSKSIVIVDNDFGKNPARKKMLKDLLKVNFIELESPEIESLLSGQIINTVLCTYPSVSKAVGSIPLQTVNETEFKQNKIGYIIDNIILKDYAVKRFAAREGKNASLKPGDKFHFCVRAIDFIERENMTPESIKLIETILDFVMTQNKYNA